MKTTIGRAARNEFGKVIMYAEDGTRISPHQGWTFESFSGLFKFDSDKTPEKMGWGTPRVEVFRYVGKTVKVLIEGFSSKDKSMLMGYTDTMKLVNVKCPKEYIGKIVNVKITDVKTWSMDGEIVE